MFRLFMVLIVSFSFIYSVKASEYEDRKLVIEKEVEQIAEKCWDNVSIKDVQTTADMRISSYEVVNCLESVLKEKVKTTFKYEKEQNKVINAINDMHMPSSDFYFTLYNANKYCCVNENDKFCHCGTSAQVEYYFPWIENIKKLLVDVIMIEGKK